MELTPVLDGISSGGALGVAALVIWALLAGQLFTRSQVDDLRKQLDRANSQLEHQREHGQEARGRRR